MSYNPEVINDVANWFALVASIPSVIGAVSYSLLAPWYRTWLGVVIWGWLTSIALVLVFIVSRRFFGAYWGYEIIAVIVYPSFAFFTTAFMVVFYVERRHDELLSLPLKRHNALPEGTSLIETSVENTERND